MRGNFIATISAKNWSVLYSRAVDRISVWLKPRQIIIKGQFVGSLLYLSGKISKSMIL